MLTILLGLAFIATASCIVAYILEKRADALVQVEEAEAAGVRDWDAKLSRILISRTREGSQVRILLREDHVALLVDGTEIATMPAHMRPLLLRSLAQAVWVDRPLEIEIAPG